MARVGFRAIGKYQDLKLDELDRDADKLADRVDGIVAKGKNAIASHHKGWDQRERTVDDFEKAADELSNGGPPLDDSPEQSPRGEPGKAAGTSEQPEGTSAAPAPPNAQVGL